MFHAWLVKIANTLAHSTPSTVCGNNVSQTVRVTDRNPSTGTDCNTSSTGNRIFSARRSRAAAVAYTNVNTVDTTSAANIRASDRSA